MAKTSKDIQRKPSRSRKPKRAKSRQSSKAGTFRDKLLSAITRLFIIAALILFAAIAYFDILITNKFEGQKWALPADVYTRPLDIYIGQQIEQKEIIDELRELGYQEKSSSNAVQRVGQYYKKPGQIDVFLRSFAFWDNPQDAAKIRIFWQDNTIVDLRNTNNTTQDDIRIEPRLFGSVSPLSLSLIHI